MLSGNGGQKGIYEQLNELQKQGKLRQYGDHTPEELRTKLREVFGDWDTASRSIGWDQWYSMQGPGARAEIDKALKRDAELLLGPQRQPAKKAEQAQWMSFHEATFHQDFMKHKEDQWWRYGAPHTGHSPEVLKMMEKETEEWHAQWKKAHPDAKFPEQEKEKTWLDEKTEEFGKRWEKEGAEAIEHAIWGHPHRPIAEKPRPMVIYTGRGGKNLILNNLKQTNTINRIKSAACTSRYTSLALRAFTEGLHESYKVGEETYNVRSLLNPVFDGPWAQQLCTRAKLKLGARRLRSFKPVLRADKGVRIAELNGAEQLYSHVQRAATKRKSRTNARNTR